MSELDELREELSGLEPSALLRRASERFGEAVTLASSLGVEDQVLTHMLASDSIPIDVFTLDTGRLFNESYELIARTREELGITIRSYAPDATEVEEMVNREGVNLFYRGVELRKECGNVRKVRPLARALAGMRAWITGLRRSQSTGRSTVEAVEWDASHGIYKLNPLAAWSDEQVWAYIHDNRVPYHALHDRGFPSIGCAPCTRAVAPGEHPRSGRWWWEEDTKRECGIHIGAGDAAGREASGNDASTAARPDGRATVPRITVEPLRLR